MMQLCFSLPQRHRVFRSAPTATAASQPTRLLDCPGSFNRNNMEELLLQETCLTLVTQNNLICASYPGAIVFGKMKNKSFLIDKCFRFMRNSYHLIFLTFVQIAKVLSGANPLAKKKILTDEAKTYYWEVTKENEVYVINFSITKETNENFSVSFSPSDLNNFCMTIRELILPSLCLKYSESELLRTVSLTNVTQIKRFKIKEECYKYAKQFYKNNEYFYEAGSILLYYYRDIIMLLHKLDQFYSDGDEDNTVKLICGDINGQGQ